MRRHLGADPSTLVGALYDAAVEPSLWPQALDQIGDALGGAALVMGLHRGSQLAFGAANRLDPDGDMLLREQYARPEANPLFAAMPRLPVLAPVERDALISEHDYFASGLFNDVFRRQGLVHSAVSCLAREKGVLISCGVLRRTGAEFDADSIRLYGAILPHLRRALELTVRLSDLELARRRAAAAADASQDGLIIVDDRRRILFNNFAAEQSMARSESICRRSGLLDARHPVDARRLAQLIQDAALRKGLHGGCMRIGQSGGAPSLAVIVTPMPADVRGFAASETASALVTIIDLTARPTPPARHLAELFGFSKAEADLAIALLDDKRAEDIALERDVKISTIRSQLRSILAKTGMRRQSEVIRLLAQVPGGRGLDRSN